MTTEEKQHQRVFLRERFLRLLTSVWGVPTEFTLHAQTKVKGRFSSADIELLHFQVEDLETPLGTHPAALLRSSDVLSLKMDLPERIIQGCKPTDCIALPVPEQDTNAHIEDSQDSNEKTDTLSNTD